MQPKVIDDLTTAPRKALQTLECADILQSSQQKIIREGAEVGRKFH